MITETYQYSFIQSLPVPLSFSLTLTLPTFFVCVHFRATWRFSFVSNEIVGSAEADGIIVAVGFRCMHQNMNINCGALFLYLIQLPMTMCAICNHGFMESIHSHSHTHPLIDISFLLLQINPPHSPRACASNQTLYTATNKNCVKIKFIIREKETIECRSCRYRSSLKIDSMPWNYSIKYSYKHESTRWWQRGWGWGGRSGVGGEEYEYMNDSNVINVSPCLCVCVFVSVNLLCTDCWNDCCLAHWKSILCHCIDTEYRIRCRGMCTTTTSYLVVQNQ